jgi:hypothetical protein
MHMKMYRCHLLVALLVANLDVIAQNDGVIFHWDFDDTIQTAPTVSTVPYGRYTTTGHVSYVPGVHGKAIRFDGFSSYTEAAPADLSDGSFDSKIFRLPRSISVEAWVALGAYPWNWAPILMTGKYGITGFYFGIDSRGCAGFLVSDGTSTWHECLSSIDPQTKLGLELHKWYHLVGTIDPDKGLSVYVNGRLAGTCNDFIGRARIVYSESEKGFRMGMNRDMLAPTDAIRNWATYPSKYSLDGLVDEIRIYDKCLSGSEVQEKYASVIPENEPNFAPRHFPTVKPSGRFGASYARLAYYPEWDAIWPAGYFDDVVVQFDRSPVKVMFWRGTRYSPCLVSENGKWMADQSRETGGNWFLSRGSRDEYPTGCMEHMSDVQCRSSRVAIIESNEARVVVNWRYLQMDVRFRQNDVPDNTGFGEWGNELYYIYPDGVMVRKVLPGYGGWQETIFLNEPGTRPEDNVELEAVTLVDQEGRSKSYSWEKGYPRFDLPGANIQVVNFKSKYKPYLILRDGGSFSVFNGEVRPEYSHFPWWNHWPVAQISSDGRGAIAADRASHSSLSWGDTNYDAALYGMTDAAPESLVPLARSWNFPPELRVKTTGIKSEGYDFTQRAYLLTSNPAGGGSRELEFTLEGSPESPVYHPAFLVRNAEGTDYRLTINGKDVPRGTDFRMAVEYDVEGTPTMVVWVNYESDQTTIFGLTSLEK